MSDGKELPALPPDPPAPPAYLWNAPSIGAPPRNRAALVLLIGCVAVVVAFLALSFLGVVVAMLLYG